MPIPLGQVDITFSTDDIEKVLSLLEENIPDAVDHALTVVAKELLKDSIVHVPVLTGALVSTGRVEPVPTFDDALRIVRVVYGSADVIYAAIQHDKDFNHPSLGFFGPAKFLEKPLLENAAFYQALLVAEYQLYLKQNGLG